MGIGMFLGTMAKKPVIKQAVGIVKSKITDTLAGVTGKSGEGNVGLGQILGGAEQAKGGQADLTLLNNLKNRMKMDNGFYGHNKVQGIKQDGSGFYKHSKKVGNTLF